MKLQIPVLAGAARGTQTAAAAQQELATTTRTANRATSEQASVQAQAAAVARAEAKAQREAAAAARESARAHEQLARGAGATGLGLLGARGATLAAGSEFLVGAAAVTLLAKSVQGAIEDEETLFGVSKVLGDELGNKLAASAKTLADSYGIVDDQALKFEGALAATLTNVGLTDDRIAELSESLVKVAADLAAVRHVPVEDTLKAIQLSVSGNTRALRQYGIVIQNSEVQQRALANSHKDTTEELTRQELTLARIQILYERTAFAQGGFADNADSVANKSKILKANIDQLSDSVGRLALGPVSLLADVASRLAKNIDTLISATDKNNDSTDRQSGIMRIANAVMDESAREYGLLADLVRRADQAVTDITSVLGGPFVAAAQSAKEVLAEMLAPTQLLSDALAALGGTAQFVQLALNQIRFDVFTEGTAAALEHLTQLDIVGGTSAQKIATIRAAIAQQREIVQNPPNVAARRAAREKIAQLENQIRGIEAADAAAAESARSKAEAAARKAEAEAERRKREAQKRLDDQDHRLLLQQQLAQGRIELKITRAAETKSLVDDIAQTKRQVALLNQQIKDAAAIHDRETRLQTIQDLTAKRLQAQQSLTALIEERRQNIRDRKVAASENAIRSAQLDVELAQTLKRPHDEIAALRRENKALEAQKALWRGNTIKQKEIRNEIAANNAQIKEIQKQFEDRNRGTRELQFQFLQTQQGFVANLLGNLIPTGATAGLVGGAGAISTATSVPAAGFATAAHQRPFLGSGVKDLAATGGGPQGATQGQMSILIQVNRHMLAVLMRLAGHQAAPEANRAWKWESSSIANTWGG